MKRRRGYTIAELVVVVLILGVLTYVAVPRLPFTARKRSLVENTAWKIVTDLRRTRSLAILHAATNPQGYALDVQRTGRRTTYQIVNLSNSRIIDSHVVNHSVLCEGGPRFEFNPLGALKDGSNRTLEVSAENHTFAIAVIPATGMVKCVQN
jgi:prepilin-type N-terminal cleavage/methylation domain-containing protein